MTSTLRARAQRATRDLAALSGAGRDPRVPWYAKALALALAGYALSPVDLIPDVIPVLGQLDDLVLLPLGIWLVVRLIPPEVMAEHRARAEAAGRPVSRTAAAVVVALWIGALALTLWALARAL